MVAKIPELSLALLVGASGAGKSYFALRQFLASEVVSSDVCRGLVSDDETNQDATKDALELLHVIAGQRMARGRLTVIMPPMFCPDVAVL
jgi:protein phosphatase